MSITEIKQAIGGWELRLRDTTPREVLDRLTFYGHIAVLPGTIDPVEYGDNLLTSARYVGVYRGRNAQDNLTLKGSGMAFWLGDEDEKGDVFETAVTLTASTFAGAVAALLPPGGSVVAGTLHAVPGTYTGRHQWESSRKAITYVSEVFDSEWRINGDATLDAGTVAQLYVTNPVALLTSKDPGTDLFHTSLPGQMAMGTDIEDLTTRVVLLAEGDGENIATGTADALPTAYKDIHGNPLKVTRLVSESGTSSENADLRATLQLNRFINARKAVSLSTSAYDVKGTFRVGDYLHVYDPADGFYDPSNEIPWNGGRINPMALRCVEMSWPVPPGWTVAFRDVDGDWIDLSPYYIPETGDTTIVVGELPRGMASVGGESIGIRPNLPGAVVGDASIPDAPVFGIFDTGNYQATDSDWTKAAIRVTWTEPLNTDLSTITDGDHYEIRYRHNMFLGYQVRWGEIEVYRWGQIGTSRWGAPVSGPIDPAGEWHILYVPWGQTQMMVYELTPAVEYEFQIRAVDTAGHIGPYSTSVFSIPSGDIFPPSQPAVPVVAASTIALQISHSLGKSSGGTFNLEADLHHLDVHVGLTAGFVPAAANKVGSLLANAGMMQAGIAVIGTFQISDTTEVWVKVVAVDKQGNTSPPSVGVQQTAELIDDAYISNLSVTKVTAGTIMAAWILAGSIKTATTGARMEMDALGLRAYNSLGVNTVDIQSDGDATITGTFKTQVDGAGVTIVPGGQPKVRLKPSILDTHEAHFFSDYYEGGSTISAELSMRQEIAPGLFDIDGGKLMVSEYVTVVSHQPMVGEETYLGLNWPFTDRATLKARTATIIADAGATDMYLALGTTNADYAELRGRVALIKGTPTVGEEQYMGLGFPFAGKIAFQGKWASSFPGNAGAVHAAFYGLGAGFGGLIVSYGTTMLGTISPLYSIAGGSNFYSWLDSVSATGYQITYTGAQAHNFNTWVVRT